MARPLSTVTFSEAATILKVSEQQVRKWHKAKTYPEYLVTIKKEGSKEEVLVKRELAPLAKELNKIEKNEKAKSGVKKGRLADAEAKS